MPSDRPNRMMPRTAIAMSRICCGRPSGKIVKKTSSTWIVIRILLGKSPPNAASFFIVIEIGYVRMQMIAFTLLQIRIIPEQLIQTASKGHQNQGVDEEELDDVDDHATEWHLQRSQMWIDGENVNQFQEWEDHASRKYALRHQHRIVWVPLFARVICTQTVLKVSLREPMKKT